MLELLFLLLPIAAFYGWYMGQRSIRKNQESINHKFSSEYVTGLNFLLSNQHEKAVDIFLSMLQKQESENQISSQSQFEAELTLGNLFRSRGEVDKALRIHRHLEKSPDYSFEQKLLVKQQLAKDYFVAGFYDRAEDYYIELLEEPEFSIYSLSQLAIIYQNTKEWQKAINVTEKLLKISPESNTTALSHYYCEYALNNKSNRELFIALLKKALHYSASCTRASIILADCYLEEKDYISALKYYHGILLQDTDYLNEILSQVKLCYQKLNQLEEYELFLHKANQIKNNSQIDLALADVIANKDGLESAQNYLYKKLENHSNILTFHRFIYYQMDKAEPGIGKESLTQLHKMVGDRINKGFKYRCVNCGYSSYRLVWNCPSCRKWQTVKPIHTNEEII